MSVNVAAVATAPSASRLLSNNMQPSQHQQSNTFSAGDLAAAHRQLEERLSQQAAQISQLSQLFGGAAAPQQAAFHGMAHMGPFGSLQNSASMGFAAPTTAPQLPPMNVSFAESVNFGALGTAAGNSYKGPGGGGIMKNNSGALGPGGVPPDAISSSTATSSAASGPSSVSSVRKAQHRAQRRILLLRHAKLCPHAGGCPVSKQCGVAQKLCRHIEHCSSKKCVFPHCVSSRCLLSHYKKCTSRSCGVCLPVKRAIKRSKDKKQKNSNESPSKADIDDDQLFF